MENQLKRRLRQMFIQTLHLREALRLRFRPGLPQGAPRRSVCQYSINIHMDKIG